MLVQQEVNGLLSNAYVPEGHMVYGHWTNALIFEKQEVYNLSSNADVLNEQEVNDLTSNADALNEREANGLSNAHMPNRQEVNDLTTRNAGVLNEQEAESLSNATSANRHVVNDLISNAVLNEQETYILSDAQPQNKNDWLCCQTQISSVNANSVLAWIAILEWVGRFEDDNILATLEWESSLQGSCSILATSKWVSHYDKYTWNHYQAQSSCQDKIIILFDVTMSIIQLYVKIILTLFDCGFCYYNTPIDIATKCHVDQIKAKAEHVKKT